MGGVSPETCWASYKYEIKFDTPFHLFGFSMWRITDNLHEDQCAFMVVSHWILLRIRNISDKVCRENQNTHYTCNNIFFPKIMPFMRLCGKIFYIRASVLHTGPLRLQTHTRNVNFSLRIENCYDTFFNSEKQILMFLSLFFRFVIFFF